jgi:hypothetical protein
MCRVRGDAREVQRPRWATSAEVCEIRREGARSAVMRELIYDARGPARFARSAVILCGSSGMCPDEVIVDAQGLT